jgi:hypothetical protein
MRLRSILGTLALLLALGWLYGGDALILLRLQRAPWAALPEAPAPWLTALGLGVAVCGAAAQLLGRLTRRPPAWRPFLLLPVAGTLVLLLDLGLLSPARAGASTEDLSHGAVALVAEELTSSLAEGHYTAEPRALLQALAKLGPPPFYRDGVRLPEWSLALRGPCAGPPAEVGAAHPGTVLVCLSGDGSAAWVSVVTLTSPFGTPQVPLDGAWVAALRAPVARTPSPERPPPMWDQGTPGDLLDGG